MPSMGMFQKIGAWFGNFAPTVKSAGEKTLARVMSGFGFFGAYQGWAQNRTAQAQHLKGWTYIAIRAIAEEVAGMTPQVAFLRTPDDLAEAKHRLKTKGVRHRYLGGKARQKAMAHLQQDDELELAPSTNPLVRLLKNPNGPDVAYSFYCRLMMYLELTGSTYIWVVNNALGKPAALWVLPSQLMRAYPDPEQQHLVGYYEMMLFGGGGGAPVRFERDEIIQISYPHPLNYINGLSALEAGSLWIDIDESQQQSQWWSFVNGPNPGLILELDPSVADPDQSQQEAIRAKFKQKYSGTAHAKEPLILSPGLKAVPGVIPPDEMDYLNSGDCSRDRILALHRVSKTIAGITDDVNYAGFVASVAAFRQRTIKPKLTFIGQVITEKLARRFRPDLVVFWPDQTPEDPEQVNADIETDLHGGAITIDEHRAIRGREPYEFGGKDPLIPIGLAPMPLQTGEAIDPDMFPLQQMQDQAAQAQQDSANEDGTSNGDGNGSANGNGRPGKSSRLAGSYWNWVRRDAGNCGIGSEGFESGNDCAAGGGSAGGPSAKKPRVAQKKPSEKALRAKAAHHMVDKDIQRYSEEHNEPKFAKSVRGESEPDNKPYDVIVKGDDGNPTHGLELKTMVDNKSNKITMKNSAMLRKAQWEAETGAAFHTVVYDDQKVYNARGDGKHGSEKDRVIYYRRGAGSFRVNGMHQVKDHAELLKLMSTADDALPTGAKPTGNWVAMRDAAKSGQAVGGKR